MERDHRGGNPAKPLERPRARQTHPLAWFGAACCTLLWICIILGGLAVLVVYLVFRPRNPRLDIPHATLNGAYLDGGALLNADLTLLANISNPNGKVGVQFGYLQVDVYYRGVMIATQAIEPFEEAPGEAALRNVHMIASQVELPAEAVKEWRSAVTGDGVGLEVEGRFRTRLDLGGWLHYTYWLHGRCDILMRAPPNGALVGKRCTTRNKH